MLLLAHFRIILVLLSSLTSFDVGRAQQVCPVDGMSAGSNATVKNDDTWVNRYLLTGAGTVECYGVIRAWVFYTPQGCTAPGPPSFEVWRPTATVNTYQFIGVNDFDSNQCGSQTNSVNFEISPANRIAVQPGDVIGWNQPTYDFGISYDFSPGIIAKDIYSEIGTQTTLGDSIPFTFWFQYNIAFSATVIKGDPPSLDNLPDRVSLPENTASSSLVFQVMASHDNNAFYANAVQLSFTLFPPTAPFTIQNQTGANGLAEVVVAAGAVIDYEQQSRYDLTITVTGLGLSASEVLVVDLVDENEPHNITNLPASVSIPAPATAAGQQVFMLINNDPDNNSSFPVIYYYLLNWTSPDTVSDEPPFTVDTQTGSVKASTDLATWYLQHPLNSPPYPIDVTYDLTILATDGVYDATGLLTIHITDIKQPPKFMNLPSTITVKETITPADVIYQVIVATSPDTITYTITNSFTPFCIDKSGGSVSLCSNAKLDACDPSGKEYSLEINATNSVLSSVDWLNVTVELVNTAPSFSETTYVATIDEKCPTSCFVVTIDDIVDRDLLCNPPEQHVCRIVPGTGFQFFTFQNCKTITNSVPIDLDQNPEYETIVLRLEVEDSGKLTGHAQVTVNVINYNDYDPVFRLSLYHGSVQENAPGGTSILTVHAKDSDSGINGEIEYSIQVTDPYFDHFQVDSKTGVVRTRKPLDAEKQSTYDFHVTATDRGSPARSASTTVTVDVSNLNENPPEIVCSDRPSDEPYPPIPCFYNFDLIHNAKIGHVVSTLTFSAKDSDTPQGQISFDLAEPNRYFVLAKEDGMITVNNPVESYKKYILYVYADDNGYPRLSSSVMNVRVDTYRKERQYIDLTVRPTVHPFDQDAFLFALRNVTGPWFMKIASSTTFNGAVQADIVVTVYALADISSYDPNNVAYQKTFVDRDDMLDRLRENIYGDPKDILTGPMFEAFPVIKVMPTYVNWWLDTVEGIATIVCLSVLGVALIATVVVVVMKVFGLLCFKAANSGTVAPASNTEIPETGLANGSSLPAVQS